MPFPVATRLATLALAAIPILAQTHLAPPTPPPTFKKQSTARAAFAPVAAAPFQYSVGEPTDEEQLYLELINRARKDPVAEANRLLNTTIEDIQGGMRFVDDAMFLQQMSVYAVTPPLSFNAKLITAARNHSQYLFDTGQQSHGGPGPTDTLVERIATVDYLWSGLGENVYSYAYDVEYGHAGFEVDWTGAPAANGNGGMQTPPGHRNSIHDTGFVEIGIGVVNGFNTVGNRPRVGPQLVTQDFATPGFDSPTFNTSFITGVAYYDLNGNNFYDLGEGLSGVTVKADGNDAFAVTSASGAYSFPVTRNKTYTVRITAAGLPETTASVPVASSNVKIDFKPAFVPTTVVSSPSVAFVGVANPFRVAALGGATGYRARVFKAQAPAVEGAEETSNITFTTSPGYSTTSTAFRASGSQSFRLAHPDLDPRPEFGRADPQLLELKTPLHVKTGGQLAFKSVLGVAHPDEIARVEISTDEGATWKSEYSQAGAYLPNSHVYEEVFITRTINLSAYVGRIIRVRFNFDAVGLFFPPTDDAIGWYIDDISFTNVDAAANAVTTTFGTNATFPYTPAATGTFLLQ